MIIQMPIMLVITALALIMLCAVLPSLLLFVFIIKGEERYLDGLEPEQEFFYAPPEYMERMWHDPKASMHYIPRYFSW